MTDLTEPRDADQTAQDRDGRARVAHTSVYRPSLLGPPVGTVVIPGPCGRCGRCGRCGLELEANEPVNLLGQQVVEGDGLRTVDLTGAEWSHQRCPQAGVA